MRTTLSLDPDVAQELKSQIAERKTSLKEVVNDALRRGLAAAHRSKSKPTFRVAPRSLGFKAGIDMNKLNQLLDESEVQEIALKMQANKKAAMIVPDAGILIHAYDTDCSRHQAAKAWLKEVMRMARPSPACDGSTHFR